MLHTSLHKDAVFLLLAGGAWTQPPLSKLWQGPGASSPKYRSQITLYHMMEASAHTSPPQCCRSRSLAHTTSAAQGYGTAAPMALGRSPVLAQHAVPADSQPASASPRSASLWSSSHSCADTRLLLLLLHASAIAAQVTAGVAAKPQPSRGPHHTDV